MAGAEAGNGLRRETVRLSNFEQDDTAIAISKLNVHQEQEGWKIAFTTYVKYLIIGEVQ